MNNFTKLFTKTTLMILIFVPLLSQATEEKEPFTFSGHITLATELMLRGFTYTNEEPALYGAFDIEHDSGVYIRSWASNINLLEGNTVKPEDRANLSIFLYGGYRGDITDDFSYDVYVVRYLFPGAADYLNYEFTEYSANFFYSIQDTDFAFTYLYSPDFFVKSGKAHYYTLSVTHTLANDVSFGGNIGMQTVSDNDTFGSDDYLHYGVSLSLPLGDFTVGVQYSNTDLDKGINADDSIYFTLTKSF